MAREDIFTEFRADQQVRLREIIFRERLVTVNSVFISKNLLPCNVFPIYSMLRPDRKTSYIYFFRVELGILRRSGERVAGIQAFKVSFAKETFQLQLRSRHDD